MIKKSIILILLILGAYTSNAQNKYDKLWNEVETLELEGKFKSANEVVNKILKKAKRSNQSDQIGKGFIYKSKFTLLLEEEAQIKIISELESSIKESNFPTNALLESVYAGFLEQYLKKNRYKIRKRTKLDFPTESNNFLEWDMNTFVFQIARHYELSLSESINLKKLPITDFQSILTSSKTSQKFRPTLYDFLVDRAINFYKLNKWGVTRPKERFYINDPVIFQATEKFVLEPFFTKDSIYSNRNALKLYQQLESFHKTSDTIPYIDVVLARLKFARKNANIKNKDRLYLQGLNQLSNQYKFHEVSSIIDYQIANFYFESSNRYNAKTDISLKEYRIKALALCNKALEKFPNSDGGLLCNILKNKIEEQSVNIQTEKYLIPEKPFLAKVTFKSVDSLYLSAYKVSHNYFDHDYFYKKDSLTLETIKKNKHVQSRFYKLQPKKNFYKYSTEVDFPGLPIGSYLIVSSSKKDITSIDQLYNYQVITVSNLSMLSLNNSKSLVIKLLERQSGIPIQDVNLSVINDNRFNQNGKTNAKGEFHIIKDKEYHNDLRIIASHKNDTLLNERFYLNRQIKNRNNNDGEDERIAKMSLYLDRSIYRPGQTVYFKGVLIEKNNGKSRVVPKTYTSVIIYDANGEEIKEFRLKTNEYGSISGEFKIPSNVLTGEFSIEMDEDYGTDDEDEDPYYDKIDDIEYVELEFSVEEYKRPTFEVSFNSITENYTVQDSIKVTGLAKAYLGASISNAKVKYSISRETEPNWNYNFHGSSSQIISTGTTQTDSKGEFNIQFKAIPDSLTPKANKPVFLYTVKTDITDTNGETRSSSKTVKVGYHNLKVNVILAHKLNSNTVQKLKVETKNLNDESAQADVELSIYKLTSPKRILRKKPWGLVDLPHISKEKFIKLFPNEAYDSTYIKANWKKGELVFNKKINTSNLKEVTLNNISAWKSGSYVLETIAIDTSLDTVSTSKNFELYHPNENFLSDNQLFDYEVVNSDFKKDQFIKIKLKTASKSLNVHLESYYKGKSIFDKIITLEKGSSTVKIPVSKNYKNKLDFNIYFVKFNSLYTKQFSANFPETEKTLQIETLSFRNKMVPDQKETWSFKITNSDNKNADAEVLASMYDTSLDQFKDHSWNSDLGFRNYNYSYAPRIQGDGFFSTTSFYNFNSPRQNNIISFIKNYHKLNWFGFNFGSNDYQNKVYLANLASKNKNPKHVEGNINGIITDGSGMPLPGTSIIVKGTTIGTQTDFDGFYSINASIGSVLEYSFLGFITSEVSVTKSGTYNIALTEDASALDEVVVVALGIQKKNSVTGSISYLTVASNDFTTALSGRVAGLTTQSDSSGYTQIMIRGYNSLEKNNQPLFIIDGVPMDSSGMQFSQNEIADFTILKDASATALYGARAVNGVVIITTKKGLEALTQVEVRNDLKETAFFLPHLKTNKDGEIVFSFDSPQALTKWRLMLMAHNKTLEVGVLEKTAVTQKDINITPNAPRFLRENDTIKLSAKISNLTEEKLSGIAALQLFNGVTMEPIGNDLISIEPTKTFTIPSKGNIAVNWNLTIPEGVQAIQYKIVAKSGKHSDGESNILPVLSNRILVTEAKPLWVPAGKTKEILFEKLQQPNSATQKNHKFSLEYTSNPSWLAIKSLPYLMEFPYECSEQTFSRFYANALAENIISKNPEIETVFKSWKSNNSLQSPLDKNEELKSILNSETPWVRDLQSDEENNSRLANLFDKEKVRDQQLQTLSKLKELQSSSGGFPWFSGGRENAFITRHIVSGIGHLQKLNVETENDYKIKPILKKAIDYLDSEFVKQYYKVIKHLKDSTDVSLNNNTIHYLYSRSFFQDTHPFSNEVKKITTLYLNESETSWLTQSLYNKGMIALTLYRKGNVKTAKTILEALNEQAVQTDESGMYWKENIKSWYWYKSPIETQALLIEAYTEIEGDIKKVEQLKQWLIKNKQTNKWGTTKATTEAIYALLMHGNNWLSISDNTNISIGNEKVKTKKLDPIKKEAGTGYLKINWSEKEINSEMATVKIENKSDVTGIGGVYWQYFEDLDKITSSKDTPLSINKKIFIKKTDDNGESLIPITLETPIKLGDLITVRIEIKSNSDMEFIHLKDLRASGFEPIDVLSKYKWQDGLGYYQSTKDVATHFFFDKLPKGSYVFEYDLRANNSGNFSNGISTIQSMYAPEFTSNSKGIRLSIE